MNLKIENRYLNITNYPDVEKYLESMASRGWLINKIIASSIFVFKKIQPRKLDFSISPYEIETDSTRKSKSEIKEFESICESVGWNYVARSSNLLIYYKEKNSEAMEIHTDEEEEFRLLENIGGTQMRNHYRLIPFIIFLNWMVLKDITISVSTMKNLLYTMIVPLLPMWLISNIIQLLNLKRFLEINKENVEQGKSIEYSEGKFYFIRTNVAAVFLVVVVGIVYVLYVSIFLKNKIVISRLLPVIMATIGGALFEPIIKSTKKSKEYKRVALGITMLSVGIISAGIGSIIFKNVGNLGSGNQTLNRDKYKVLLTSDFIDTSGSDEGTIAENISILVPKSYEYKSEGIRKDEIILIETEYYKALNSGVARALVEGYKSQRFVTIAEADHMLWNADEAYFLTNDKHGMVLRKGKEVFALRGIDFSDLEVIEVAKEKLGL